jgi:hypothetical protein
MREERSGHALNAIRPRWCAAVIALCLLAPACGQFEKADHNDCVAVYEHAVDVYVEDHGGKDGGLAGMLARKLIEKLMSEGLDLFGEQDKFVRECMATFKKSDVRNCLTKRTWKSVKECRPD